MIKSRTHLIAQASKAIMTEAQVWSWRLWQIAAGICFFIVAAVVLSGNRTRETTETLAHADQALRTVAVQHGTREAAKRTIVNKPISRDTQINTLLSANETLEADVVRFVDDLLPSLSTPDAVQVRTLNRLHTTGHFLRELDHWAASTSHRDALSSEQQEELAKLIGQWSELQQQLVELSKQVTKSP